MISKLQIRNIQSHKETNLNFNKGVNIILGSSNNGKTAILRALYWLIYNRPLGIDNLASHWILDKKGNLNDEMSVSVTIDDNEIVRKRTKDGNFYLVNGKILEAVKTDVPEEVSTILKLNETNIQRQQDAPFLLSLSPGEIAKYFNKVVRLDIIDKVLSNAESKRRKNKQEVEYKKEFLESKKKEYENYSWIPEIERLLDKYNRIEEKSEKLNSELMSLSEQIQEYEKYISIIEKAENIIPNKKIIEQIEKQDEKINELNGFMNQIDESIELYNLQIPILNCDFSKEKELIKKIEDLKTNDVEINSLSEQIQEYEDRLKEMENCENEISRQKELLPDVCPICGGPLNKGECKNEIHN